MNAGFLSNTRFWRQPRVATVAFVALFVGGCNHEGARPVVSIADAKQIAAEFEGASFVPPPRTISDITAILDEQKPADPTKAAKAQAAATKEPPRGAGGISLARFYWERGLAAEKIGDAVQQIADLKTAERLSRSVRRRKVRAAKLIADGLWVDLRRGKYDPIRQLRVGTPDADHVSCLPAGPTLAFAAGLAGVGSPRATSRNIARYVSSDADIWRRSASCLWGWCRWRARWDWRGSASSRSTGRRCERTRASARR